MPIEIVGADTVFNQRNKAAKYPSPDRDPERYTPYPTVSHKAAFEIKSTDKIFTIGSCFARNTERALIAMGMPVLSALVDGVEPNDNITNKYTTKSILHDLQTAFSSSTELADSTIIRERDNSFYNLTFGGAGAQSGKPLDEVQDLTRRYFDNLKKIEQANIVILTLGLVEVWYDKETSTYLNVMPSLRTLKQHADRFEMHVLSYEDIVSDVEEILSIIRSHAQPNVKFLITVSPVPLHATFRDQDYMQANCYSKSVQRAAVDFICLKNADVAYFPSYEMVSMAAPQYAWISTDYRHVRPEMVDRIMRTVLSHYLAPGVIPPSKQDFQNYFRDKNYEKMISLVEEHLAAKGIKLEEASIYCQYYFAQAAAALGKKLEALDAIRLVTTASPKHNAALTLQQRLEHSI